MNLSIKKIGYARRSDAIEGYSKQIALLVEKGVPKKDIHVETVGIEFSKENRPIFHELMRNLQSGSQLCIAGFYAIARSPSDLEEILQKVENKQAYLYSIQEDFDTSYLNDSLAGLHDDMKKQETAVYRKCIADMSGLHKNLMLETALNRVERQKIYNIKGGRKQKLDETEIEELRRLYASGTKPEELREMFDIGKTTLYGYLNKSMP